MSSLPDNVDGHEPSVATGAPSSLKPQCGLQLQADLNSPVASLQYPSANLKSLSEYSLPPPAGEQPPSPPSDQKLPIDDTEPSGRLELSSTGQEQPPANLQLPSGSHFPESGRSQLSLGSSQPSDTHESQPDNHQQPFVAPKLPSISQEQPSDVIQESASHQQSLASHQPSDSLETPTIQQQPLNSPQQPESALQPSTGHKRPSVTFKLSPGSLETSAIHEALPSKQKSSLAGQEVAGQAPANGQLSSGSHQPSPACQLSSSNSQESSINHQPPSTSQQHPWQLSSGNLKSSATHQPAPARRQNVASQQPSASHQPLSAPGDLYLTPDTLPASTGSLTSSLSNQPLPQPSPVGRQCSSQRPAELEIPAASLQPLPSSRPLPNTPYPQSQPQQQLPQPQQQLPQPQTSPQRETSPQAQTSLHDLLHSEVHTKSKKDRRKASGPQKRLEKLLSQSCNKHCADCGSTDPKWVSISHGVFICIKCSGIHRSLGVHISKVLSVKLDEWTDDQVTAFMEMGGNIVVNKKLEAYIPEDCKKPKADAPIDERAEFIRRKYEMLEFTDFSEHMICPYNPNRVNSNGHGSSQDKRHYEKQTTRHRIGSALRNGWIRKDAEQKQTKKNMCLAGMVEFIGLIKVNVVKGTNLAIRDMVTSDPYVILALGHQSVRTRVIKNNLNPVWNESLMLSIPDHIPPLKVLVYDKDTFSTDDFMGEAEIDIQPLVSAARAYETSSINESTQLGKWMASRDNSLVKDGVISLIDGKVKQEISLRLQNVERGVLEIELECVPLTQ